MVGMIFRACSASSVSPAQESMLRISRSISTMGETSQALRMESEMSALMEKYAPMLTEIRKI